MTQLEEIWKKFGVTSPPEKNHLGSLFLVCNIILTQSEEDSKRQNRGLDLYDPKSFLTKKMSNQKKFPFNKIVLPIFYPDHQKSNFFSTTICFTQIFLRPKFFSDQIIFPTKFFVPIKNFSDQKCFWARFLFDHKFFQPKYFSYQFFFRTKIFFRPKIFVINFFSSKQNFFQTKNMSDQIVFLINLIGCDIKVN